jgi:hypothetical protein
MTSTFSAVDPIQGPLSDVTRLTKVIAGIRATQVRTIEPLAHVKAVALTWFNSHRGQFPAGATLDSIDQEYRELLLAAERAPATKTLRERLKRIRSLLVDLRAACLIPSISAPSATSEAPPSFARLVADPEMQALLEERWRECLLCVTAGAPLAATVMMGGLLESLLLARLNREPNKQAIFTAASAPKLKGSTQAAPLKDWTLQHYIDVGHELKWISQSARGVGEVLRDFRNYIHPHKQLAHKTVLTTADATLLWEVAKSISRQLV